MRQYLILAVVFILFLLVVMIGVRYFNSMSLIKDLYSPTEGVECLIISSTDGTAVDCWKK